VTLTSRGEGKILGAEAAGGRVGDRSWKLILAHVLADALALAAALALAGLARFSWGWLAFTEQPDLSWRPYAIAGIIWIAAVLQSLASRSMYDEDTLVPGGGELARALKALPQGVAFVVFVAFLVRGEQLSRSWFLLSVAFSALLLPGERLAFRGVLSSLRERGWLRRPVVLVRGPGSSSESSGPVPRRLAEFDVVREIGSEQVLEEGVADEPGPAFLTDSADWDRDQLWEMVLAAGQRGSSVFVLSGLRSVSSERMMTRDLDGRAVTRISPPHISGMRAAEKRALDLVVVLVFAVPALALAAILALVQLLTSGRPVMYRQSRLGRDGKEFMMWKFRSMRRDAEAETGPVWADHDDPRRTGFGRFLRRSSLDELPQLWNVLKGDMSMVGPRPERPEFVARFSADMRWYRYRLRIKPGLTGQAQALGLRGKTPLDSRVDQDNWYIENWSLALDLRILAGTLVAVVRGENAE